MPTAVLSFFSPSLSLPFSCCLGVVGILGTIEKNYALFYNLEKINDKIIDVFFFVSIQVIDGLNKSRNKKKT